MSILNLTRIPSPRDYTLGGPEEALAHQRGLIAGDWYRTPVPRKRMKELMRREDAAPLRDTALWIGLLLLFGALGIATWGTLWAIPVFAVYGLLYATAADSRWHEMGHGTAFRTRWLNDVVFQFASFLLIANPVVTRWEHAIHHTDTIVVGRDPEIPAMRPPQLLLILVNFFGIIAAPLNYWRMLRLSAGRFSREERYCVPEGERPRAVRIARIHLAVHLGAATVALATWSLLPLMLIGLPRFYGIWLSFVMGVPQHIGLAEDVLDHRLNTRTILMNPVFRFFYSNMNYHIEHHMFPMVPYYRLPALHEEIRHDCPPPYPSVWAAWREIIPCVLRQLKDPHHFVRPALPPGAAPVAQIS
ncbi:fatty acid desaturase [Histidinibacterium lentulum]|uniref:Fatty acid desaturase n=1 Tax=Histidinibacterium lentulum TaxID=2480588 RepID=A0A3N2QR42_9RHOB|nr:fatty acid desaturase [Histidinibacterium lentulum]ROT97682.1 fatty acid desaturase [Histidinibacterium lentulum]